MNVTKASHTDLRVKGTGCVAADLNGDGYTDLVVTTATGVELLWNNGNGTFTQAAQLRRDQPRLWLVLERGRRRRQRRRPPRHLRCRLHEHARPDQELDRRLPDELPGRARPPLPERGQRRRTAARASRRSARRRARVVALPPRPRRDLHRRQRRRPPDLYVANDDDPNDLYLNEPGGPLGFHFVEAAKAYGVDDRQRRDGRRRGRLQRRRPARSLHHELARRSPTPPTRARILRTARPAYAPGDGEVREGARPQVDRRLGRLVGRPRQQRQPRPDHRQRRHPGHEPEAGHGADPGAAGSRRRQLHERERHHRPERACRRSSAAGSPPPTSTTTAGWGSRSTRSAARSSCCRTPARSATGSRSRSKASRPAPC